MRLTQILDATTVSLSFGLATPAAFTAEHPVNSVEMNSSLFSIGDSESKSWWEKLRREMECRLRTALKADENANGHQPLNDVTGFEMANSICGDLGEAAVLAGNIRLRDLNSMRWLDTFRVEYSAREISIDHPDIIALSPTSFEYYDALLTSFAGKVVEEYEDKIGPID